MKRICKSKKHNGIEIGFYDEHNKTCILCGSVGVRDPIDKLLEKDRVARKAANPAQREGS